jgi:hypothetical protein
MTSWIRRLCIGVTLLLLATAAWVGFTMVRSDPSLKPPKTLVIATRMTVRNFIEVNGLSVGPRIEHGFVIDADKIGDWEPLIFDDHWIALDIRDGEQSFTLPPGRALIASQLVGHITGFALRPFAQPRPLEELHAYILGLLRELEDKGWQPALKIRVPEKPEDFDFSGTNYFAELTSASGNLLQMNLTDYGLAPKQESFILNFNRFTKPSKASHSYLLQITVDMAENPGYSQLIYPRRLFVNGSKSKEVPLKDWINDPDWTPQKAGMVESSPEERAKPDSSDWVMPPSEGFVP